MPVPRTMLIAVVTVGGAVALLAGAGALCTTWLTRQAERDFPPLGQFVTVGGVRLHYVERGPAPGTAAQREAPPLVLLHGAFGALQDFTATILDDLARSHRTIAFDRPGHGYSGRDPAWVGTPQAQAALIHEALLALGIRRAVWVGFSYGGAVALAHALAYPEATAALVLLAAPSHPWADPIETEYFVPTWPVVGPLIVYTAVAPLAVLLAKQGVAGAFYPLPVAPGFVHSPYPLSTRPASFIANAEDMRVLKESVREMSAHYGEIALPVTIVHGTLDHVVGLKIHSEPFTAKVPQTELIRLPGAGHQLLYSHSAIVRDAIERAMAKAGAH